MSSAFSKCLDILMEKSGCFLWNWTGIKLSDTASTKLKQKKSKSGKNKDTSSTRSRKSKNSTLSTSKGSNKSKKTITISQKNCFEPFYEREDISIFYPGIPELSFQIEYELFPNFKYVVDVVCWGPVVKISSTDGNRCFTTIIENNTIWILIPVQHLLQSLNDEQIQNFTKHLIKCNILPKKNSLKQMGKSETDSCIYYILTEKLHTKQFEELLPQLPTEETLEEFIHNLLEICISFASNNSVSRVYKTHNAHCAKINKTLSKLNNGEDIFCNSTHVLCEIEQITKNKKSNKNAIMSLNVPAQILLTEPCLSTFKFEQNQIPHRITNGFAFFSCTNLLSARQKFELGLFVIKLQKISNLPYKILLENGFRNIFLNCRIPDIANLQTLPMPVANKVIFKESTIVFTNCVSQIKILNLLQNVYAVVEICSSKETQSLKQMKSTSDIRKKGKRVKSKKPKNKRKSNKSFEKPVTKPEIIVLGAAVFDLGSLLSTYWMFKEKGPVFNVKKFISSISNSLENFSDRITINQLNLILDPIRSNKSPLTEEMFVRYNTTVKFEAAFMAPQFPHFYIQNTKPLYQRVIVIVFNEEFAKNIINEILTFNKKIMGAIIMFSLNLLAKKNFEDIENALSGYLVDDGNNFIFFIEGPVHGHILTIIHKLSGLNLNIAKVFYNSNLIFEERVYKDYIFWNGFFFASLKMPLRLIFSKPLLYVEGNVPVPCWKALQKLNLIVHSNTYNMVLRDDLIINQVEIISLSVEFGLQLNYKYRARSLEEEKYFVSSTDLFSKKEID